MKFYKIMPASLVTVPFECNERSREDSYSKINVLCRVLTQWAGLTELIVGGVI